MYILQKERLSPQAFCMTLRLSLGTIQWTFWPWSYPGACYQWCEILFKNVQNTLENNKSEDCMYLIHISVFLINLLQSHKKEKAIKYGF